jgi:hypothetical protein
MPTFPGYILPGSTFQEPPSWSRSPEISEYVADFFPFDALASSAAIAGAKLDTQPVTEPALLRSGSSQPAFGDDWYHRIHVIPSTIDLGNLVSNQQRRFEVWNAYFDSRTLGAIVKTGSYSGLTLSGAPEPPLVYGPLQSYVYTLTALTAGYPVIDSTFEFVFGAEAFDLRVLGRRVVIWLIRPDWSNGISERLEWHTDVLAANDGSEQRVRLRKNARRVLEMAWLAAGRNAMIADTLLTGWGSRKYCVPIWMERDVLASPVASGATSVTVTDAALKDYAVGGYAVLWASETQAEAIEISAISGNTLTFKTPVAASYGRGASVCPAMFARIDGEANVRHVRSDALSAILRFADEAATDRHAAEIGPTWNGYAVLDERPDYSEDQESAWSRTLEILDNLSGVIMVDDTTGYPVIRRTYAWIVSGRAAIDRWKKWASARAGRLNALWLPSFMEDVEIVHGIATTDTIIVVRNALNARYGAGMPSREAIRIETTGGQVFHLRVTAMAEIDNDTEQVTLDSTLGTDVPVSIIRRAMWMGLARLESDAVEIHYETDGIARIQATFRLVKQ